MELKPQEITRIIKEKIEKFKQTADIKKVGTVIEVGDGVARIYGLQDALSMELLAFPHNIYGLALNLEEEIVGACIFGDDSLVKEGDPVYLTGKVLEVPVGEEVLGRVLSPLGRPLDGKEEIKTKQKKPVEIVAPGVAAREPVSVPLETGIKAIDAMIPIGRGQRELIIGDRQVGKTAIALDTIINQKGKGVYCFYVAIGQKNSTVAGLIEVLKKYDCLKYTTVIVASAAASAPLQYIAPYAATTMAEYFRDQGKDALIIYDDLTKHAVSYRELSLLLRRPPGREAYPGDIFYTHSRLLERACKLNKENGGGSLTALPIIETQAGDVTTYIPTNLISITDGQIYLENGLFYQGVRPAVNVGLSVSRVGGSAQIKAMRQVAGMLRLELAQFREMQAFAQLGTELDKTTQAQIERGRRLVEILKQDQFSPLDIAYQVIIIYAAGRGWIDDIPVKDIRRFEEEFFTFISREFGFLLEMLAEHKEITPEIEDKIKEGLTVFKKNFIFV